MMVEAAAMELPSGLASCRTEVLEYGNVPICPWLTHLNSLTSLQSLLRDLIRKGNYDKDQHRWFVAAETVNEALGTTPPQVAVLFDLLAAVIDDPGGIQTDEENAPAAVDAHRLALFLFAQYYTREAGRAETADVWPPDHPSAYQAEPSSPMRLAAKQWAKDQTHHRGHLPAMRQKMQEHLLLQEAVILGFSGFVASHIDDLLELAAAGGGGLGGGADVHSGGEFSFGASEDMFEMEARMNVLSPVEVDRLGLLLEVKPAGFYSGFSAVSGGGEAAAGGGAERAAEDDAVLCPMDVCDPAGAPLSTSTLATSPFEGQHQRGGIRRFSSGVPASLWSEGSVPCATLAGWLSVSLGGEPEQGRSGGNDRDTSMGSSSPPPRPSAFDQLAPPLLNLLTPVDVHDVHRATVLRGEADMVESGGGIRILDCHDAVVYCLAPLRYATVSCCSDCVILLGAVGKALRLERCERVQVIAAATRVTVNTCHDCILYLSVNRPPLLLGDNRFLQMAPHNAGYERLEEHAARAGVTVQPNMWASATPLLPDPQGGAATTPSSIGGMHKASSSHSSPSPGVSPQAQLGPSGDVSPSVPARLAVAGAAGSSPLAAAAAVDGASGSGGTSSSAVRHQAATVLPPEKFMPFMVPFRGGDGPFCGGPAAARQGQAPQGDDAFANLLGNSGAGPEAFGPSPFPLPAEYAAAWEDKMAGVSAVRAEYRAAGLDEAKKREFIAAIQGHFKEWLQAGGGMREVYDLAKAEKESERMWSTPGSGGG